MNSKNDKIKRLLIIWVVFLMFLVCTIVLLVKSIMSEIKNAEFPKHVYMSDELDDVIPFDADYSIRDMMSRDRTFGSISTLVISENM